VDEVIEEAGESRHRGSGERWSGRDLSVSIAVSLCGCGVSMQGVVVREVVSGVER